MLSFSFSEHVMLEGRGAEIFQKWSHLKNEQEDWLDASPVLRTHKY
jgi:hypothetical protein